MQVTEICEIVYKSDFDKRKDDPSQYFQLYKAFISNKGKLLSSQIFIPHLKNDSVASISDDIQNSLLVGGYSVTSITNQIF
jgi:hypothetical protein